MNFIGKYVFTMPTPSGERETTFLLRNYYTGALHGTLLDSHGGVQLAHDIATEGNRLCFESEAGPSTIKFDFTIDGDKLTGTATVAQSDGNAIVSDVKGSFGPITDEDDGADKIEMKGKALILYASITKNTERVATWFKETFEHYGMKTTMVRVLNGTKWMEAHKDELCFDDYDVVCLGSPIIGGSPMKCMLTHFSAGAASSLEDNVAKNAEKGLSFNAGGAGGFKEGDVKGDPNMPRPGEPGGPPMGGPGMPPPGGPGGPGGPGMPPPGGPGMGAQWRREMTMQYPGGPHLPGVYKPLGIAFTTYGGGFSGPNECLPVLSLLKLYLEDKDCKVIGRFACPGKEFGPAGLDDGEPPVQIRQPPVYYKDADGNYHAGGFFFHTSNNNNPAPRHEAQAKAFIASIVEDHFLTWNGKRRDADSEYVSIC